MQLRDAAMASPKSSRRASKSTLRISCQSPFTSVKHEGAMAQSASRLIWLLSSEALSIRGNFIWIFGFIVLSFAWNYRSSSHLCLSTALSKCAGWVVLLLSTSSSARACFFTFVWAYPAIPSGIVLQRQQIALKQPQDSTFQILFCIYIRCICVLSFAKEGYFLLTVSVISSPSCEIVFASLEKKLPTFSKKRGRFSKFRGRFSEKSPSFFEKRCSIAFPSLQIIRIRLGG